MKFLTEDYRKMKVKFLIPTINLNSGGNSGVLEMCKGTQSKLASKASPISELWGQLSESASKIKVKRAPGRFLTSTMGLHMHTQHTHVHTHACIHTDEIRSCI